jgi:hypothetical protein
VPYRSIRLCAGGGAYEAVPSPRQRLDLARVRATLEAHGIPVIDARVLLIATLDHEVTISRDGRLLFKTRDAGAAEQAFRLLGEWLDLPPARTDG